MIQMDLDVESLLKFVKAKKVDNGTIVGALNNLGTRLRSEIADDLAVSTGMKKSELMTMIKFQKASSNNMEIRLDASQAIMFSPDWLTFQNRPLPQTKKEFEERKVQFMPATLVNVITAEDDKVCPKCMEIASNGPYRIEEARQLIPHHRNCRCAVTPFYPKERVKVQFMTPRGRMTRPRSLGVPQIAQRIIAEELSKLRKRYTYRG